MKEMTIMEEYTLCATGISLDLETRDEISKENQIFVCVVFAKRKKRFINQPTRQTISTVLVNARNKELAKISALEISKDWYPSNEYHPTEVIIESYGFKNLLEIIDGGKSDEVIDSEFVR